MAFLGGFLETLAGISTIAAGVLLVPVSGGLSTFLISAGVGLTLSGVGTMLTKGPLQGFATASKNPTAPWNAVYGRARVGGTLVYDSSFGDSDKWRDLVFVLACHPCQSVDELMFDQQRIQIGTPGVSEGALGSNAWSGSSFSPVQKDPAITTITRVGSVVTVHLSNDIPLLDDGDQIIIQNVHPVSAGLNGKFPVTVISHSGTSMVFSYISGGTAISIPAFPGSESGDAHTAWADYGRKVFIEVMLGKQTLGQTFQGMLHGTPEDGDGGVLALTPGGSTINPWTANCSLVGMTCVFLRLHYNDAIFANGLPQISFHIHGKNDILLNPGGGTPSYGYTENAALCIADYLSNAKFGFGASYGTEIPTAQLAAAATVCDQAVTLAEGGTEPRYTCNGGWVLTTKRGEVLKNLLTSCAGRLTDYGGQFVIWPGAWGLAEVYAGRTAGVSESVTGTSIFSLLTGAFRWKPKVSITDLYNGVKGTYICPANNWQSSDFPPYAQDIIHGFASDANQAADGGDRRWFDIQLPFTISCPTAQRLAKIELMRRRQQGTGTFPMNMAAYQFTPMDVIAMDLSYFAWTAKSLEVLATRFVVSKQGEVTLLGIEIDVQETDTSIYEWSIGEELSPAGYQQAITPSTMTPGPPTNVILRNGSSSIIVTWTAPADGYILNGGHIELEYQIVASPEGLWLSLAKMDPTVTQAVIPNLILGDQYNVQIRAVNAAGIPSVWVAGSYNGNPGPITIGAALPWSPGYVAPLAGDALYPAGVKAIGRFGVQPIYTPDAQGNNALSLSIKGNPPINVLSTTVLPPSIDCAVGASGFLAAGDYVVGVSAFDTGSPYANTGYSNLVTVTIPAGPPNGSIDLTITWQTGSNGGDIYMASPSADNGFHLQMGVAVGVTTATITAFDESTAGGPDPLFDHFAVKWKKIIHSGPWAQQVQGVTATTITIAGAGMALNQWAGYVLSLLAKFDLTVELPVLNMPVASSTASSGGFFILTIGPNSLGVQLPDLTTLLAIGDLLVMRSNPTFTPYTFEDPNIANPYFPNGMDGTGPTGVEAGHLAMVMTGPDAGDVQTISSVSAGLGGHKTIVNLASAWQVTPNTGDIVIIVASAFVPEVKTQPFSVSNKTLLNGVVAQPNVLNLAGGTGAWLFLVDSEDSNNASGLDTFAPVCEVYLFPSGGTRNLNADSMQILTDGIIQYDTSSPTHAAVAPTTLTVAVTSLTQTAITVAVGTGVVNGAYITVLAEGANSTEDMLVLDGGGTTALTVARDPGVASLHASTAVVHLPGRCEFTLLPITQIPNQGLVITKLSSDINYLLIIAGIEPDSTQDTFPGGGTTVILPDDSASLGTFAIKAPGA